MNFQHKRGISMRELQKMSSAQIAAMTHPVPITSGGRTIAYLQPRRTVSEADLKRAEDASKAFRASLTEEEAARIDAFLRDIGGE